MIKTVVLNGDVISLDKVYLRDFMQGFSFGAGLFETFVIESGIPLLLKRHLDRLKGSLRVLKKHMTGPAPELLTEAAIRQMLQRALESDPNLGGNFTGIGKIIVSDGQLLIQFRFLPPTHHERLAEGVALEQTVDHLYRKGDMTLNHKLLNYFRQFMHLSQPVLFINEFKEICETPTANIFLEMGDRVVTPPLAAPCLPGTIRDVVLADSVLPNLIEADLPVDDLAQVKGGFLTNSVSIAIPIKSLFGKPLQTSKPLAELVRKTIKKKYLEPEI